MKRILALTVLLLPLACSDGPTGPEPVAHLNIHLGDAELGEATIQVGQALQLSAAALAEDGDSLDNRPVAWNSTDPEIAQVDAEGLVIGLQVGSTSIIATLERASDTLMLSVISPPPSDVACRDGDPVLDLAVGEVYAVPGNNALTLCVAGGDGSEYTYIPFNASQGTPLSIEVEATGIRAAVGPPNPYYGPYPGRGMRESAIGYDGRLSASQTFHAKLRAYEDQTFSRLANSVRATPHKTGGPRYNLSGVAAKAPTLGELIRLNVNTGADGGDGCTDPDYRYGRVEAISEHAVVVADTANPEGGFERSDYERFARAFDELVYPVNTRAFGTPSDIDENGRAVIFYTRAVNELTEPNSSSYIGGFYFGRDLRSTTGDYACEGSNEAEMFYMLVADPDGEVNGNERSKSFVADKTIAVLAHEFQHLINFSRRVFENGAEVNEDSWLNEGLSHIAEELVFYEASGTEPRSNLTAGKLEAANASDAFFDYQFDNLNRLIRYLQGPSRASLMGEDVLPTRGAAWSFLRYAADRHTGDDGPLWFALANSTTHGVANLQNALADDPLDWMEDWAVSLYADDAGLNVDSRYTQPSWNLRELIPAFRNARDEQIYDEYPLDVRHLLAGNVAEFSLMGGAADFLRFGVAAGDTGAVRLTQDGYPAPPYMRVIVVRTR
ncbi:MAG TPA: Ig-like domain-containing protein [Longimicrobiaceae bacterium]|nr:Ig-like domain-containing protein [Longimicrobiaceae bacterium]